MIRPPNESILLGETQSDPVVHGSIKLNVPGTPFLQAFKKIVILLDTTQGFQHEQVQKPAKQKDADGEADLPCQGRLWPPPDHG